MRETSSLILSGGNSGGKTAAMVRLLKEIPKAVVLVKDLKAHDVLVEMGVDPSQIILSSDILDERLRVRNRENV